MGRHIGRWLLWIGGAATIGYMSWNLVLSDHGYLVYRQEAAQLQLLRDEVDELKRQRELLSQQILHLRNDPDALEELVHRELGYVHPDEFMLIMPDEPDGAAPSPEAGSKSAASDRRH
ncbi:septum formation initiator family protein [Mariprofundus erugo]|uniref:Septum formation initiator family protein n=1 Tax=Mariprofundus erugo TaxID=2528639 RepID=A0A5R9GVM5_9PROT|nr:septum formation initiator family protein [Mariprofundus erugo]TLS68985.1 septum formation initiator family protein [Mariprofundus erugo]TLS74174.1 septum formation initiator family protein [Mariprofundus erugo]